MRTTPGCLVAVAAAALASAQTNEQTVHFAYDDGGRLASAYYSRGSTNMAELYQYDLNGNRTNRTAYGLAQAGGDLDGDGLSDVRELSYFRHLNETASGDPDADGLANSNEFAAAGDPLRADTDADGQGDLDEFIAGTHLADPGVFFRLPRLSRTGEVLRLSWEVRAARTYQLQGAAAPDGAWTNAAPPLPIAVDGTHAEDRAAEGGGAYRIQVRLTP